MDQEKTSSLANLSVRDMILGYLRRHPRAKDSLEGIVEWWLLDERIYYAQAAVEKALAELVAEGWVVTLRTAEGRVFYSLNPSKGTKL